MAKPRNKSRNGSVYRRVVADLKDSPDGGICWRCEGEIDRTLPPEQANDPKYWTADHVVDLKSGGDLLGEMRPAHRSCNSRAGALLNTQPTDAETIEVSRQW